MVNWGVIDNVFLDMDGTLLDLHFDNYFWLEHLPLRYAQIRGIRPDQVREYLLAEYNKLRGKLDWYCLEYWQNQLEIDILELKREVTEKIQLRPSVTYFLEQLKKANKTVALVSNAHPWSIDLKTESVLSVNHFDAIYSSHDFGHPKEDQKFWQLLQEQVGFDAERTLFIDDNEQVLESAERFGIAHLLSVHQPDLRADPVAPGKFSQVQSFQDLI